MNIAIVLYTGNLKNDDRVRKIAESCSICSSVNFVIIDSLNSDRKGIVFDKFSYSSFKLKSRELFPNGKLTILKSLEFYLRTRKLLTKYDFIWVCDEEPLFHLIFTPSQKIIWDLHEHPARLARPFILFKTLLRYIENRLRYIIHANQYRKDVLINMNVFRNIEKSLVLRNFPDKKFVEASSILSDKFLDFKFWLKNESYVFVQGISSNERYPIETIKAIIFSTNLKIVIVGSFNYEFRRKLEENSDFRSFKDRIFYTGVIDILQISPFIKNAMFSIVFYSTKSINSEFCEPNRFFQPLAMGIPVIVGENPTMREIVETFDNGISVKTDGNDIDAIITGITTLIGNYKFYRNNAEEASSFFFWEMQNLIILNVLKNDAI